MNKVKYYRLISGLLLKDLSEKTGLSVGHLSHIENGNKQPSNLTYERYNSTLQSYMGMMKHNDCYRFKMQLLEDVETIINESGVAA